MDLTARPRSGGVRGIWISMKTCKFGGIDMSSSAVLLLWGATILFGSGCATVGQYGGTGVGSAIFNDRTGQVTESDLYVRLPRVLARHGFFIVANDRFYNGVTFETQWRLRDPFPEEQARGATAARTQVRFRATHGGSLYSLQLQVENMIQIASGEWIHIPLDEDALHYAREVASDVRLEIASGIRRF